jgi:hypothetical protein
MTESMIPADHILRRIHMIRGQRVILDSDLAELYGVSTKRLNEQVRRNSERFPADFMFQLTDEEIGALVSQLPASKKGRGGRRHGCYAFSEFGAIMAANVLNSPQAVQASVLVVRAFVHLRQMLATHRELAQKLAELEQRIDGHDEAIIDLMTAIRELMAPPPVNKPKIGFQPKPKK